MKILILEDNQDRIEVFRNTIGTRFDLVIVTEAAAAIQALQTDVFDVIFLDHDLGGKPPEYYGQNCDLNDKNTGSEVVRWICEHAEIPLCHVIIHSLNEPAAESMHNKLDAIGWISQRIPFTLLAKWLRDPSFIRESC